MEEIFIPLGVIGFTLTVLSPYFFNKYTKYKLEKEKMRLESEIRKEEIRAQNQFNMEKYLADEQLKAIRLQAQPETQPIASPVMTQAAQPEMQQAMPYVIPHVMPQETNLPDDGRGRERVRY